MMKRILFLVLLGLSIGSAMAEGEKGNEPQTISSTNAQKPSPVQQWLELQRSGKAASPQAQPMSGEVMEKVHQRYLKSFEKPIPEFYAHDPVTR